MLEAILDEYDEFKLSEESIKKIHLALMSIKYHSVDKIALHLMTIVIIRLMVGAVFRNR